MHPPYQDIMDPLGLVHTAAAVVALALGPAIFLRRKGDRLHRRIGWAYATSMIVLSGTAFAIYDLFGHWGPFHYGAVFSMLTLAMGLLPAITRRPRGRWLEWHYAGMSWSYAGLAAAAVAETLTRLPGVWPTLGAAAPMRFFWIATGIGSAAVIAVAVYLIRIRRVGFPLARVMAERAREAARA